MKTLQQVKEEYKSECADGRDKARLSKFIPENQLKDFEIELRPEFIGKHKYIEFTRDNILTQLKEDLTFAFEKALNQRGISSSFMFEVVKMWNWILEEGLEKFDEYAMYGLPLYKATALKYGFENLIGENEGSEEKYNDYR